MAKIERDTQGVALYLEFRKENATCQVLITPDGVSHAGKFVGATFYRRVILGTEKKRKWRAYTFPTANSDREVATHLVTGNNSADDEAQLVELVDIRLKQLNDYFTQLNNSGYKLVNDQPIYVEVTRADLESVAIKEMPTKVWSRIKSVRQASGFPEEVVTTSK